MKSLLRSEVSLFSFFLIKLNNGACGYYESRPINQWRKRKTIWRIGWLLINWFVGYEPEAPLRGSTSFQHSRMFPFRHPCFKFVQCCIAQRETNASKCFNVNKDWMISLLNWNEIKGWLLVVCCAAAITNHHGSSIKDWWRVGGSKAGRQPINPN